MSSVMQLVADEKRITAGEASKLAAVKTKVFADFKFEAAAADVEK